MHLKELIADLVIERIRGGVNLEVEGLTYDSRKVESNFIFVAISGFREDGHQFIARAIEKGARVIIIEKDISISSLPQNVILIKVSSSRLALAKLSNCWYRFPSREIKMIGITGTNGKTTTVYLVESILKRAGFKVGKISTIDYTLGRDFFPSSVTTPESQDLQGMLKAMVDRNLDYAVMEVSSHSLVLHRVEGVEFDRAVFTNISPEHMDFHKNGQEYLEAKVSLFEKLGKGARKRVSKKAIINIDDPVADYLIERTSSEVITYAVKKEADVRGRILEATSKGVVFILEGEKKKRINLSLLGLHNVYNALAAASVALEEDIPNYLIEEGLQEVKRIPGRLEPIDNKNGFNIFVDYAHTEDGLKKVLQTLQGIIKGKLVVVFGCGGDRDSQKRPLMGKVALREADYSVITSDNPRSEDPGDIIAQIEKGVKEEGGKKERDYLTVVDRKEAIKLALEKMQKEDTLLIAGKGHEKVQIFKDKVVEFDDRKVVQDLLAA